MVLGAASVLLGCGADDAPSASPTTGSDGAAAPTQELETVAESTDPIVVATEGTVAGAPTDGADDPDQTEPVESDAADLDAAPLASDASGDVPAGPPAPDGSGVGDDGSTVSGGDGDDEGGDGVLSGGTDGGDASGPADGDSTDRPEPTIDSDTSPDDGDVVNGVSGDTEVRDNLSYPSTPVTALGRNATTDLAAELGGSDQPTLLWFWTPDCPTCVPESAVVARFADTYRGSIRVLGVGAGGNRAEADAFAADGAVDASMLVWAAGAETHAHYNVTATPFAIMVAPNGVVMAQWRGMVPELFAFADRL